MVREICSGLEWWGQTVKSGGGIQVEMTGGGARLVGQGRGSLAWAGLKAAGARAGWMGVTSLRLQEDLSALEGGFF